MPLSFTKPAKSTPRRVKFDQLAVGAIFTYHDDPDRRFMKISGPAGGNTLGYKCDDGTINKFCEPGMLDLKTGRVFAIPGSDLVEIDADFVIKE